MAYSEDRAPSPEKSSSCHVEDPVFERRVYQDLAVAGSRVIKITAS